MKLCTHFLYFSYITNQVSPFPSPTHWLVFLHGNQVVATGLTVGEVNNPLIRGGAMYLPLAISIGFYGSGQQVPPMVLEWAPV